MARNFMELLAGRHAEGRFVCVGLDTDYGKIPDHIRLGTSVMEAQLTFNRAIVDATADIASCYKPNTAFFEQFGEAGWEALRETILHIHRVAPEIPVILDAKRGDIGNTNAGYVEAAFHWLEADAITVHPYLGQEALAPFLEQADKGVFVLCRTSNKGAGEFQDCSVLALQEDGDELLEGSPGWTKLGAGSASLIPFYHFVARRVVRHWNANGNCGLVVGATYPGELKVVRELAGDMPILIPGIGAQGGDLETSVLNGINSQGGGIIVNSSRGIIFASSGKDFAQAARRETLKLHEAITACLVTRIVA